MTEPPVRTPRPTSGAPAPAHESAFPALPLSHLDTLWIQVAGTLCNLRCAHCFVSSGPGEDRHPLMTRAQVGARVAEALPLGVREFYFTGGEPFVHPEMIEILEDTIEHAPCTVLTNGVLFTRERLRALARISEHARYSLEVRVSLDGDRAETHDAVRGPGTFERALGGLRDLEAHGLLPIVAVTRSLDEDPLLVTERYHAMLRAAGLTRPRLKTLPLFQLGRETRRSGAYRGDESLRGLDAAALDAERLQCGHGRAVTARGVFVCPLLVDEPGGRMGDRLDQALVPAVLSHGACFTCHVTGMTCGNG